MSTITTRAGKGTTLTHAEVDANFTNLNTDKLESSAYTASDVLTKIKTVDGSGSGLDADLLQGITPTAAGLALIDDADAAAQRTTLGVVIGTNVQAHDALLDSIASQTVGANKIQSYSGDDTASLLDFKDEDDLVSDSATAVPSQQSVKAYVDGKLGIQSTATISLTSTSTTLSDVIPSTTRKITISFNQAGVSGGQLLIQVGNSSYVTTGYTAESGRFGYANTTTGSGYTTGFGLSHSGTVIGHMILTRLDNDIWVCSHTVIADATNLITIGGGVVDLTSSLDRVRVTTTTGTDTLSGTATLQYE